MLIPWRRFRISTRCRMGCFFSLLGMKNAACCSGLFHPHNRFDVAKIRNNIQTCKQTVILLRFIFIFGLAMLGYPSRKPVFLTLLVRFLCMGFGLSVNVGMMLNTKCLKIGGIETELLHLQWCSPWLDGNLVVDIDGWTHETFSLAQFAEWILLQFPLSQLLPSFGVQQLLIFFTSAHIISSIHSLTSSRISSKVMGNWRWKPSPSVVVISQISFALRSRLSVTLPFIAEGSKA